MEVARLRASQRCAFANRLSCHPKQARFRNREVAKVASRRWPKFKIQTGTRNFRRPIFSGSRMHIAKSITKMPSRAVMTAPTPPLVLLDPAIPLFLPAFKNG